ncbi:ribosomal lysine N-methyltransferase set11 [Podospora fimiseda]|uniref:Ribosomal lysine N-methyltransferase set11 n=1 Tax=Podospora fimiseda TaxID=252190 RepID=A0AAN7H3H1_9PEZI|nr:ribosomal lysine N-methyltransferase set11 [Podospora fimiseda]
MEAYDELLRWAAKHGIEIHSIAPQRIPGRGIGIVATKPIKASERLLLVPTASLRGLESVKPKIRKALPIPPKTKAHAILAADLALDKDPSPKYAPWNAVVPSQEDITSYVPLAWRDLDTLRQYLPSSALNLLQKQEAKFQIDWKLVSATFPTLTREKYLYHWLLVNTRTFYHENSRTAKLPRDDRMILQPVADLFNHADVSGCEVAFDASSFTITAERDFEEGEEVYICYGKHSNDFLLVEYGFVMDENRWDEVLLDEVILEEMSERQKELLEEKGFLGNYVLDERTPGCYRTQVALRLVCVSDEKEWERFVEMGEDGGKLVQRKVDEVFVKILSKFLGRIERMVEELEGMNTGLESQREVLIKRWGQIRGMVEKTIKELEA